MALANLKDMDDELYFKSSKISISSSNKITTPIKASLPHNPISGINEIYKQFSDDTINKMLSDEKFENSKNYEIRSDRINDKTNFFFVEYTGTSKLNDDQLESLSDIQYAYSDVVLTPILSKLIREKTGEAQRDLFLDLTNKSIEISKTLNNKPVVGIIPAIMPRQYLKKIINNYYNKGITCFAIDYCGKSVDSNLSWGTMLTRLIADYDIVEESFIYGLNVYEAHFRKKENEVLAKDFISLGCGVDVLGLNHMPPRLGPKGWNEIKNKEKTIRIFDPENYAYVRVKEADVIKRGITRDIAKKCNNKAQFIESQNLRKKLNEKDPLKPYMETKNKVSDKLVMDMKSLRNEALKNQNTLRLDHYF